VFINYRGEDSHSYGALLYAELSRCFGAELVFLDSESIPAGADFPAELLARVRGCGVLLAVIGPRWLSTADAAGRRRIDDPRDWVRRELAEAFAAGVRVVPVLTDGADLPGEAELPAEIAGLGRCQFRRLRHREASGDLGRLRADLAGADPVLAAARRRAAALSGPVAVPAQLPRDVAGFAGRGEQLARLDTLLAIATGAAPTAMVISAVSGTAGVGKTALAVHWAHRIADRFPDGQLYVNLRGFDPGGQVMAPAAAVRGFLDALGVPAERVPSSLDAQVALYRSLLAGRRVLVVLDNARDAAQARPLLPGTPTALVVVTSRSQLTSLVAVDGAHSLTVALLTEAEARELLTRRLGPDQIVAEPQAVEQIVASCARLPLALTIAAARAEQSGFPLAALAGELAEAGGLDALDAGDAVGQVRAVFSWSYTALSPAAARLFRLLGLHPGPDISAAAAASLAAVPPAETRRLLAELTRASLLTEYTPGRYGFHDLLRAYAGDLTNTVDSAGQRRAALGRVLDHYLHTAHTADHLLYPHRDPILLALTPPGPGVTQEQPADHGQALAWMATEHPVLRAAVRQAAETGYDTHTWQLTWTLDTFLDRQGHWHDLTTTWHTALPAGRRLNDPAAQAHAHRRLAWTHTRLGRYSDAHAHLQHALHLYTQTNDHTGQAHAHAALGMLWGRQGRPEQALDHAQQALTLYRATGHRRGQAAGLNNVGWYHALRGDHQQALTYCQQALTLLQELGDRAGEADTWDSLGYAHHHLSRHTQAADCYQHALHLYRDLGDHYNEADTLTHLGDTHHAAGNITAARTAWQHALDILTDLDYPDTDTVRARLHDLDQTPGGGTSCRPGKTRTAGDGTR
jgi:tetratricopeptide (TPR) repeat protein